MRIRRRGRHFCRKGINSMEVLIVVIGISLVALIGFQFLGGAASTQLQQTSGGVGDPSQLPQSFE